MSTVIEYGPCTPGGVELRSQGKNLVGGYAARFNSLSKDFGGWKETVEPSFFRKSQADTGFRDVVVKYEHKDLLGTVRAGTAEVRTDAMGLPFEVSVPQSRGDVLELVARGDVIGASFAFTRAQDEWRHENGYAVRHLISGRLLDCSIVQNAAYESAHVGLRSLDSLARQVGVDPDDVYDLARKRELRALFSDRQPVHIDVGGDLDIRRRWSELNAKKIAADTGRRPDEPRELSTQERRLALYRKRLEWRRPPELVEARSLDAYQQAQLAAHTRH